MKYIKKNFNSHYVIGTLFYSFPSLFSIIISLISIPIFLNYSNIDIYSNYLINHFVLTIAIITNLNFGKIATINIARAKREKFNIFFTSFFFTMIFSSILTILIFVFFSIIINYFQLENIKSLLSIKILIGLFLTNLYLTLEGYFKGNLNYKLLSIFNLFFYSISISFPSLIILYEIPIDIFSLSLFIKVCVVVVMLLTILAKVKFVKFKIHTLYLNDCINNLKWMTLNTFLLQVYNYFDKYIIKIFLGNLSFVYYTVSQQITSKLGDPLLSYNNIFIAKTNKNKKNSRDNLSYSAITYCLYILIVFIILYFFLDYVLELYLGEAFNKTYSNLIKIFFLISTIGSFSRLIVDYYDLVGNSKKNSIIEILFLFPFILGIILAIYNQNLFFFVFLILLKEIFALTVRIFFIRQLFYFKWFLLIQFLLIILINILWFSQINLSILIIAQLIHLIFFLPIKKIRLFYRL